MIELAPDDGGKRLTIEEKSFQLGHPPPAIGDTVPILVNRKRTKAAFDLKDERLDWQRRDRDRGKAQRAADEARFEARLQGHDPPSPAPDADLEGLSGRAALEAMERAERDQQERRRMERRGRDSNPRESLRPLLA